MKLAAIAVLSLAALSGRVRADDPPLRERWRTSLELHSPTNVVVGREGNEARFCVQGTNFAPSHRSAGIEVLDQHGKRLWQEQHGTADRDSLPGAYVQWIAGPDLAEPAILYSFVPAAEGSLGGARLVRARDGSLLKEIANTSRFGNNNSVVADLEGDGHTKLLYPDLQSLTCYALPAVERVWRWDEGIRFCWSLPALVDTDGDHRPEIVFGSEYNNSDGSSSMIALDRKGRPVWRSDGHAEDLGSTPVFVADVDGDGKPELLKVGLDLEHRQKQQWNHLHVFDLAGKLIRKIELGFTGIAIGDMDGDGHLEGVGLSNTRDGGSNGRREIRCLDLATGAVKWTTPVSRAYLDTNSPVMADFSGNGKLCAVVGSGNPAGYARLPKSEPWGDLYVVDDVGRIAQHESLPGWPVNLAFCDVDDDGRGELMAVIDGKPGALAIYETRARAPRKDWPTPFGNSARTGTMAVKPPSAPQSRVVQLAAKDTITPVELDWGDELDFKLRSGEMRKLKLVKTEARVVEGTQQNVKRYAFTASLELDGESLKIERVIPAQESFYEPVVVRGMRIWLDAVSDIFKADGGFMEEKDAALGIVCQPKHKARLVVNDVQDRICPDKLLWWYPEKGDKLDVRNCYRGEDVWMGPYNGKLAHGGLDLNMKSGTPLYAPIEFDDQFLFNSLAAGDNNNRWRGIRRWPNGSVWWLQAHHLTKMLVPEHTPLTQGRMYAETAGVLVGAHEHTHFAWHITEEGEDYWIDPWIFFWQTFQDNKKP